MHKLIFKFGSRNAVYFRVPKTASTSLLIALRKADEVEPVKVYQRNAFTFTFVRDPYDRLVSAYRHLIKRSKATDLTDPRFHKDMSFEQFVDVIENSSIQELDDHLRPQWTFTPGRLDFVGKFEHLKEDYLTVCKHLSIKPIPELGWQNSTGKTNLDDYYTKKIRQKVRAIYQTDFVIFNYEQ